MVGEADGVEEHIPNTLDAQLVKEVSQQTGDSVMITTEQDGSKAITIGNETWSFEYVPSETSLRGGGCASSALCGGRHVSERQDPRPNKTPTNEQEQADEPSAIEEHQHDDDGQLDEPEWTGWAELENDPGIFTILVQEWGASNAQVYEMLDIIDLVTAQPDQILGLIFLSRYTPPEQSESGRTKSQDVAGANTKQETATSAAQPWFANQISKFSCGTVALMNILMNSSSHTSEADTDLSETLSSFKHSTSSLTSKQRGIALDSNPQFRRTHNSFSTKLDRMIVDIMLKEEAQKHKHRMQAEARRAKLAEQTGNRGRGTKRKRPNLTSRKKRKSTQDEEEESGFHFVAYVSAHGQVWKLDGMQAHPTCLGRPDSDQTWLNVAAADLEPQTQECFNSGQECSLMKVVRTSGPATKSQEQLLEQQLDKERKQEDWAPFIEHMLRLHCERGDLQEMLNL